MGAREVAKLLAARGLRFAFVLDEGGLISEGVIPGIDGRAALIAVGEKGFTSLEMAVRSEGGHSSMPPLEGTPGGILAAGLAKLEQNQMPRRLDAFNIMTDFIGSEMPFINRLCIANQWLLGGLLGRVVGATPSGNAIVRTTTAITRMSGSEKDNVLPQEARATINFRLLSPDTPADVIAHVKATVNDDRIIVTEKPGYSVNASRTSATNNNEFKLIGRSIKQVVPDVLVSPMITVGGTDSKWMGLLSDNVYRFTPIYYEPRDLRRFHGINERISYEDYRRSITFYANLLTNAATKNWEE
jgi:carboxypeptidase PM20D1